MTDIYNKKHERSIETALEAELLREGFKLETRHCVLGHGKITALYVKGDERFLLGKDTTNGKLIAHHV